jgi:hypothetical protein
MPGSQKCEATFTRTVQSSRPRLLKRTTVQSNINAIFSEQHQDSVIQDNTRRLLSASFHGIKYFFYFF